jgi:hypothetical protein
MAVADSIHGEGIRFFRQGGGCVEIIQTPSDEDGDADVLLNVGEDVIHFCDDEQARMVLGEFLDFVRETATDA